jgi:hypothetical protein
LGLLLQLEERPAFDNEAEVVAPKEAARSKRATSSADDLQGQLAAQICASPAGSVTDDLVALMTESPQLYEQAMAGLQRNASNLDVDNLHRSVLARVAAAPAAPQAAPAAQIAASPATLSSSPLLSRLVSETGVQRIEAPGAAPDLGKAAADAVRKGLTGTAGSLPFRDQLEASFGVDLSNVRCFFGPQAAAACESIGARAFAIKNVIVFGTDNPDLSLVAHELTHVVQQGGYAPGGALSSVASSLPMSSPGDALEREADSMASMVTAGSSEAVAGAVSQLTGGSAGRSAIDRAPASTESVAREAAPSVARDGGTKPTKVTLNFGGARLDVTLPAGEAKTINKTISATPVTGLSVTQVRLEFNDNWELERGQVMGSVSIGDFVRMESCTLSIDGNGNVGGSIPGATLKVGDYIDGTIDLRLGSGGITGSSTITAGQIQVDQGLTVQSGSLRASLDVGGNVSATGTLTLALEGIGTLTLQASLQNTTLSGSLTLQLAQPITVVDQVTIESVTIKGEYKKDGFTLTGQADVKVRDWARAQITGTYKFPDNKWSASGKVTQTSPINIGDLEISGGELNVSLKDGNLEPINAKANWKYKQFSGEVKGSYDAPNNKLSGEGKAQLEGDFELGIPGATLKSAKGTATVKDNVLTKITGEASAEIPYEGEATFLVKVGSATIEGTNFSATGSAKLLRELSFSQGNTSAKLQSGEANAEVKNNELIKAGVTGVKFRAETQVNGQALIVDGNVREGSLEGTEVSLKADATLSSRLTFTSGKTTVNLDSGTLDLDIQRNALQTLGIKNVQLSIATEVVDQPLNLTGNLTTGQIASDKVTFKAGVKLDGPFTFKKGETTIVLEAGSVVADVKDNALLEAGIQGLKFSVDTTVGGSPLSLKGNVDAGVLKASGFTLKADASLASDFSITKGESKLNLEKGGKVALNLVDGGLDEFSVSDIKFTAQTQVESGPLKVKGNVTTAKVGSSGFSVDAKAELDGAVSFAKNGVTADLKSGKVGFKVTENKLEKADFETAADVSVPVENATGPLKVEGTLKGDYTTSGGLNVDAKMTLVPPFGYEKGDIKATFRSGSVQLKLKQTKLEEFGYEVDASVQVQNLDGFQQPLKVDGTLKGKYSPAGLDIDAKLTLAPPFNYDKGDVKATFKSGSITLKVKQTKLESFDYAVSSDVEVKGVEGFAQPLKVSGELKGSYTPAGLDVDAKLTLVPPFVYEKGDVKADFKSGSIQLKVTKTALEKIGFDGVSASVEVKNVDGAAQPLKLNGSVKGSYSPAGLDLDCKLDLVPPFAYEKGNVKADFKSGSIELKVTQGALTKFGFEVGADVQVKELDGFAQPLKVTGTLKGSYSPAGLDIDCKLDLVPPFTYDKGNVKADFKSGSVTLKVARNTLEKIEYAVAADVEVKGIDGASGPLKLSGDLKGAYTPAGLDIDAKLTLTPPFTYEKGNVKVDLKSGTVDLKVKQTVLEKFGIDTSADVQVKGLDGFQQPLKLTGQAKGSYTPAGLDLDCKLDLVPPFVYDKGNVKADIKSGSITLKVKQSALESFEFKTAADVEVKGIEGASTPLKLSGDLSGKYTPSGLDLDAKLNLTPPFTYEKGDLKADFKSGSITLKVKQSALEKFDFDVTSTVEVKNLDGAAQPLKLNGSLKGTYTPAGLDIDCKLDLVPPFVYEKGNVKVDLKSASVHLKVKATALESFKLDGTADVQVKDIDGATAALKLTGSLKGDYTPAGLDLDTKLDLVPSFTYEKGNVKATFKSGSVRLKVKQSALESFDFDVATDVEVKEIDGASGPLKLTGSVKGKYTPGGLDLDAKLALTPDFNFTKGDVTAKFTGGSVTLKLKQTALESADLDVQAKVDIKAIDGAQGPLKLEGPLKGTVKPGGIDIDCDVTLASPWTYEKGNVKATLNEGTVKLKVDANTLTSAKVTAEASVEIKGLEGASGALKLSGQVKTDYSSAGLDVDAKLDLIPPFSYEKGNFKASLKTGTAQLKVEKSVFKSAKLDVESDIEVKGIDGATGPLKLTGGIKTELNPGGIDVDANLTLTPTFAYEKGNFKATLKSGAIKLKVKQSALEKFDATTAADLEVKGIDGASGPLKLNGQLKATYTSAGFDLDCQLALTPPFAIEKGNVKATFKSGNITLKVTQSAFESLKAETQGDVEVKGIDGASGPLKLTGQLKAGVTSAGLDVDAKLDLVPPFSFEKGNVKASFESGSIKLKVTASALESFDYDTNASVEIKNIDGFKQPLKVKGMLKGKYTPAGLDIDSRLKLEPPFQYEKGNLKADFESGTVHIKVKAGALESLDYDVQTKAEVKGIDGAAGPLKVKGSLTGKYTPAGLDIDCKLTLEPPFTYEKGNVKVVLGAGEIKLDVKQSALVSFGIDAKADIQVKGIDGAAQPLKLKGQLKATYTPSGLDVDAKLDLDPPFTYEKGNVKAVLESGKIHLKVTQGALDSFGIDATSKIEVKNIDGAAQPLKLSGALKATYTQAGLDIDAKLTLTPPFTYEKGNVKADFTAGSIKLDVKQSALVSFGIDVTSNVEVKGIDGATGPLKLTGQLKATYTPTGLDVDANMTLTPPFTVEKGNVKATFNSGSIKLKLTQSNLDHLTLDVGADVEVKGIEGASGPLKLNGMLKGKYSPAGLDIDAQFFLVPPFVYERGNVKATFNSGSVKLKVTASNFESFEFAVQSDIEVKNIDGAAQPLKLNGQLSGKYTSAGLDIDASLTLVPPFVYEKGNVKATFNSGSVKLKVKQSALESFDFGVESAVEVKGIDGAAGPLKLTGHLKGKYTPAGLDVDAKLDLVPTFQLEKGDVKATFNSGSAVLKVKASALESFDFSMQSDVEVKNIDGAQQPLKLNGELKGKYTPAGLDIDAKVTLVPPFVYEKGNVKADFKSGSVQLKVKASALESFEFAVQSDVEIKGIDNATGPLKLAGELKGKYTSAGLDIDAKLDLVPPFVYEKGQVKATFESGSIQLKVKASALESFDFSVASQVEVKDIDGAAGPLKLSGTLKGKYTPAGLDIDAKLDLVPTFVFEKGDVKATFNSGSVQLKVAQSSFQYFKVDVQSDVEVKNIQGAAQPLKLTGQLKAQYSPSGLDVDAKLDLVPPFVYEQGDVKATFNSGSIQLKLARSALEFFRFSVQSGVEVKNIDGATQPLKLSGELKGEYKPGGLDIDAKLDLVPTFQLEKGQVKATFKSGSVELKVVKSAFQRVRFEVAADVEIKDITGATGPLKLTGELKGMYSAAGLDVDAKLDLVPDFTYEQGDVKATFKSGSIRLDVKATALKSFDFEVSSDVEVKNIPGAQAPLKLNGQLKGKYTPAGLDILAKLDLVPTFVLEKDNVKATFTSGSAQLCLEKSAFKYARIEVGANVEVKGIDGAAGPLKLTGSVKGEVKPSGLDIDAKLDLVPNFVFEKGDVKATFTAGSIALKVKNSALESFEFSVTSDVEVKNIDGAAQPLKLNGTLKGKYSPAGLDIDAKVSLVPPFTYEKGDVKADFKSGSIHLKVKQSALESFGFDVESDVQVKNIEGAPQPLKLNGTLKGSYTPAGLDIDAKLTLVPPFIFEKGNVKATFKSGSVELKIAKSAFRSFDFAVNADIDIKGIDGAAQPLKLNGDVKGKYTPAGVDIDAKLSLVPPFTYEKGNIKADFKSGSIGVKVQQSELREFTFAVESDVEVKNIPGAAQPLKLNGQLKGKYSPAGLDIDAKLTLIPPFTYEKGQVKATFNSGAIELKVAASSLEYFKFSVAADVEVKEIPGAQQPLKLNGTLEGKYSSAGLDIDAKLTLVPPFVYEQGNVKASFNSGSIQLVVKSSSLEKFEFAVDANVDVKNIPGAAQDLKLNGQLKGTYTPAGLDIDAKLSLIPPFTYEKGNVKADFNSGSIRLQVEKSSLKQFDFDVDANVEVKSIPGAPQPLKLHGQLKGTYTSAGVDIDAKLDLVPPFTYEKGNVKADFKSGSIRLIVKKNALDRFEFAVESDVTVKNIPGASQDLKLNGQLKGSYTSAGLDIDAKLSLVPPFVYEKGNVKATFNSGSVRLIVKSSALDKFEFQVGADVEIKEIPGATQTLKLNGELKGSYTSAGLDIDAKLSLVPPFQYTRGNVDATFKSGSIRLVVKSSSLDRFEFAVEADVDVKNIPGTDQTLKLNGQLKGSYTSAGVDIDAKLSLVPTFVYNKGNIRATFKSGEIHLIVEKNSLKQFGFKVEADVDVTNIPGAQQDLKLNGQLKGTYTPAGLDIDAKLSLVPPFVYSKGNVTATFKQGEIHLNVEKNSLKFFKFSVSSDVEVKEIPGAATPLKLNGTLKGEYTSAGLDIDASLSVASPFTYERAPVKATLQSGTLGLKVKSSQLQEFTFDNVVVDIEVDVKGQPLKVKGSLTNGRYKDGQIEFDATLEVAADFTYETSTFKATLKQGGSIGVKVKQTRLEEFTFKGITVLAEAKVGAQTLHVKGTLDNGKYKDGKLEFDAKLSLAQEFTYTKGDVSASLLSGEVGVKVQDSKLKYFTFDNIVVRVEVRNVGPQNQTIAVKGTITDGRYEEGKIRFNASLQLENDFTYQQSKFKFTLKAGGSAGVKVQDNEVKEVNVANLGVSAEAQLMGRTLKVSGTINSGKYYDGNFDVNATLSLDAPFLLFEVSRFKATLQTASVTVDVKRGELESIVAEGSAKVEVDLPSADISGTLAVKYRYLRAGDQNLFSGKGTLSIKMLEGKLHGTVSAELFEDSTWKIKGDLDYKMNKIVSGKIGIEMDEKLDPVLSGTLALNNVQLHPGRTLLEKEMQIVPPIAVNIYGINFGVGCDAGVSVKIRPVLFNASITISNFRPLQMNMPRFDVEASVTSGVDLEAYLAPYLFLALGAGSVLAGIKLAGKVALKVPVVLSAGLRLFADGNQFGGEFKVGASVKPTISLSVQPKLFAQAGSLRAPEYPIMDAATYTFPELFTWEWGKTFKFGDAGQSEAPNAAPGLQEGSGAMTKEAQAEARKDSQATGGDKTPDGPATTQDQPDITKGEHKGEKGGEASDMEKKMKEIQEYAENLGKLANLITFVVDIITIGAMLSFLGPVGWLVATVIALVKAGGPGAIIEGFEALGWFMAKLADWIWSLMPDWFKEAWQTIKRLVSMGAKAAAVEVSGKIREWGKSLGDPWGPILDPLIGWAADSAYDFIMAFEHLDGSAEGLIKCILSLMIGAVSSILSFIKALGDVIANIVKFLRHQVYSGKIVAIDVDTDDFGKDPWLILIDIPGVIDGYRDGPSDDLGTWALGNALRWAISNLLGVPVNHDGKKYGHDYR